MAKCRVCNQEMLTAKSCIGEKLEIAGKRFKRIRFGDPQDNATPYLTSDDCTCGDCGCRIGGLHHWGCDMETCPKCGCQLISCDCEDVRLIVEPSEQKS